MLLEKKLKNFTKKAKKFTIDTTANFVYWQPVLGISEITFMGYNVDEMISARTGNIIFAITIGGVYGKALDLGRYLLNREYYNETINHAERNHNLKTFLKDSLVDTATTSVYWNAIMAPWLYFVSGLSPERVGEATLAYTAIYLFASTPYGKFLNFFRGIFDKQK